MDLDQGADPSRGQYGVLKLTSPLGTDSASGSADMTNSESSLLHIIFSAAKILSLFFF